MAITLDGTTGITTPSLSGPLNGTLGATTPSTVVATTVTASTTGAVATFTTTQTSGNAVTINVDGGSGTPVGLLVMAGIATIGSTAKLINVIDSAGGNLFNVQASGVSQFSAGTAALPALTTTGDTNTGIFFPAADTIAFTEGGAEAARITSAGDLLVGTTSFTSSTTVSNGIFGGNFRSLRSNATIPASSTATVMTLSSSVTGVYIVQANFGAQGNNIYGGMLIVVANSGSFRIVTNGSVSGSALTMSGANVQIANVIGSPLDAVATAVFIGN